MSESATPPPGDDVEAVHIGSATYYVRKRVDALYQRINRAMDRASRGHATITVASTAGFRVGGGVVVNDQHFIVVAINDSEVTCRPATWRDRVASWLRGAWWRVRRAFRRIIDRFGSDA